MSISKFLLLFAALPGLLLAQTSVNLAVFPHPTTFGSPVVMTAMLTPSTVTGHVTFYDGVTILGTKPVVSGTASLSTILLPAGNHTLRAIYSGGPSPVSSNVVTQQVNATAGGSFLTQTLNVPQGDLPVVADFNGDGIADIAFLSSGASSPTITVLLGKGGGTFQAPIQTPGVGGPMAVGDFNGDGIPDLFCLGDFNLMTKGTVFLGNGDGTFHQGAAYTVPNNCCVAELGPTISVADLNGDGNADLLIGNLILIGHGDGTFTSTGPLTTPINSGVGDLNGDGKADRVVLDQNCVTTPGIFGGTTCTYSLGIYLGNGDGTFQSPIYAASASSTLSAGFGASGDTLDGFLLGDFNGDGKTDLLYWSRTYRLYVSKGLTVLLGNGDGSFGSPQTTSTGVTAATASVTTGDFNGDGTIDVAVANVDGTSFVLTGKGDGTFQPSGNVYYSDLVPSLFASSLIVADFNGDGKADLLLNAGGNISIFLGAVPGAGLSLKATGGTPQSAPVSAPFNTPLEVTLLNNGVPVSGATVTYLSVEDPFTHASAMLSSSTAVTNALGVARVTATAGLTPGSYVVPARSQGVATSFALTNRDVLVTAVSGTPQSAPVGTAFPIALQAKVTDTSSNAAVGAVVTFTAPGGGASAVLSSATAVTNASGIATITATANNITGSYPVRAGVGLSSAQFLLTNAPAGSLPDLAVGKTATQSSTYPGVDSAAASSAVDGNTDGAFLRGSVTATNADPNAWWQVDLGGVVNLGSIVIWNRTDCCSSRLSDYWVFFSTTPFLATDTPATLQNRPGTGAIHETTTPSPSATIRFEAIIAQARYIRVQLSGTDYLSLAEVQVFGTGGAPPPANLAQGKTATQSSTYPGVASAAASSAVDGSTDGAFFDGSVTATNADPNAWWQVDLGASASISSIVIWNRTDCCASRLGDYWIFVSDTPFLATDTPATLQNRAGTFASHQTTAPNPSTTITATTATIQGRYVRVQLSGTDYLSLAEVQVFGTGGAPPPTNLAQGKAATQSSTYPGIASAAASSAVDGNPDGAFFDGSVTATNLDPNPWWQVDLGASVSVSSIVVWNRTDCCGDRLSDYWVFVSNTPFLATDTPATLQNRAGTFASHQTTAPTPSTVIPAGAPGRYVRVQLSSGNYLSLAEVQVFGQ